MCPHADPSFAHFVAPIYRPVHEVQLELLHPEEIVGFGSVGIEIDLLSSMIPASILSQPCEAYLMSSVTAALAEATVSLVLSVVTLTATVS